MGWCILSLLPAVLIVQGEIGASRDANKKLLEQYSSAVRAREAHDLRAALTSSMAALGLENQRLAAVRIMAGLTDPSVAALHDITNKLCEQAVLSRWVHGTEIGSAEPHVQLWLGGSVGSEQ
jgi:hypothetical protein